ncbi:MAG: tetratricopeptide repeat protein [Steroidobacteraceae bacterium]
MSKNFRRVAVACLALTTSVAAWLPAAAEEGPTVSKALAKPLKAAQDSLNAGSLDQAIAQLKEAQGSSDKNAYDVFVINEMLGSAYAKKKDFAAAVTPLQADLDSPYLGGATAVNQRLKALMQLNWQLKNWPAVTDYASRLVKAGEGGDDIQVLLGNAYYLQSKWKDALSAMQTLVASQEKAGKKPEETSLRIIQDCYTKLGDDAGAAKAMDKLVGYYPKPEYFQNAVVALLKTREGGDRFKLNVYRLALDLGLLKVGDSYTEMAQIDLDQGLPGEAQAVLEQAVSKKLYTEVRDQQRNERLMENARKQATVDKAGLAASEKSAAAAATGDSLVQVGVAYMTYGDNAKAVALITQGIQKGGLKSADEAYLELGIAQFRSKNQAEAAKAFDKVSDNSIWGRLAKLWSLRR